MAIYASDWLNVPVPSDLMDRVDYYHYGGHGYLCGTVFALIEERTADYMIQNRTSDLAQHFESEYGVDLDDRAGVIKQIQITNELMGESLD